MANDTAETLIRARKVEPSPTAERCEACGVFHQPGPCDLAWGAPTEDATGAMVGGYRIVRELGRGGMGVVYLAEHALLKVRAAVKVLRSDLAARPDVASRFVDEARAAFLARNPNTVQVYDLTTLPDGRPCIVMEFVEGESIDARLARVGQLAPLEAASLLVQLCNALTHIHRRGIVHRDVKAENVLLVREESGRDLVKLLDFGIAKISSATDGQAEMLMGTPHYMAPELISGGLVTARADVYGAGILAAQMLTGRLPFEGCPSDEVLWHQVHTPVPMPLGLPARFALVLGRAWAKDPAHRFGDAMELGRAIKECIPELAASGRAPLVPANPSDGVTVTAHRVRLEVASRDAFAELERAELSQGRLFLATQQHLPSGIFELEVVCGAEALFASTAAVALQVGKDEAARHHLRAGYALTVRRAYETPAPGRAAERLLARHRDAAGDLYALLDVAEDADSSQIRAAMRRAVSELDVVRSTATEAQRAELEATGRRIEEAGRVLCDPPRRAAYDGTRGNYRGVARALAAGLPAAELAQLRLTVSSHAAGKLRDALALMVHADTAVAEGRAAEATGLLEAALALDPLSVELHERYWKLKQGALASPDAPNPTPALGTPAVRRP